MPPRKKSPIHLSSFNFPETLKKLRTARELSQTDLAYLMSKTSGRNIQTTYTQVKNWERGHSHPNFESLVNLMSVLGCTLQIQEEEE